MHKNTHKKVVAIFFLITAAQIQARNQEFPFFTGDLTAGYVFKNDDHFKETYGHGMANIITADGCWFPWRVCGFGTKISYWRAHGCTTFLGFPCSTFEVPFTLYVRLAKTFRSDLQLYGSLGGGVAWIKECSYLGTTSLHKGIGEAEVGINYPFWRNLAVTSAFRFVFPRQCVCDATVDVGGADLRAGLGVMF